MQEAQVWSLVQELRSFMTHGAAKKNFFNEKKFLNKNKEGYLEQEVGGERGERPRIQGRGEWAESGGWSAHKATHLQGPK